MTSRHPSRRTFLQTTAVAGAAALALPGLMGHAAEPVVAAADAAGKPRKFRKAVKYGMIGEGKTVREKFDLIKSIGFEGVELDAPGGVADKQEARDAAKASGVHVHGVIDAVHWKIRLSDPDAAVREQGLQALLAALDDAKFYGASTVLLVPGKVGGKDETFDQAWERSREQVIKAIPKAKDLGVHIAIEIVWNDFLTTPELMVKYIDSFNDPIVGCYLDPSNVLRYGKDTNTRGADWVRALGKRLLKFDFKGYSHEKGFKVKIGEGDEHWPDVLKALDEVGYKDIGDGGPGWATAEVGAGGREHLMDVAARMDKVLGMA